MSTRIRHPYVSGRFYPDSAREIELFFEEKRSSIKPLDYSLSRRNIYGAILPHAGYVYSGSYAVHFFELLQSSKVIFETFVILHPIHRAVAPEYAADASDKWITPMGEVDLDLDFIAKSCLPVSTEQQKWEHSAEVIVPFIQHFIKNNFKIVPIGFSNQTPEVARKISDCIKTAVKLTNRKICLLASSDFTHYDTPEHGMKMDQKVVDRILAKDVDGIYRVIKENNISVCGYGPIMSLVSYLTDSYGDSLKVSVLSRGNSGDVHPSEAVVDYISIMFHD